jgi:sigma-B regulation protein RsbU (phosphoserine phosphatase)
MSVQENGHIIYSGLHQDLLVYRSLKKEVELINTRGMWLGIMDFSENNLPVDELVLNSKDVMLLYTDGITEAVDASFEMFSEEKLEKILKDNGDAPLSEIQSAILSVLKNYTCHDDITLVIAKKLP